jgi:hypothetical protein
LHSRSHRFDRFEVSNAMGFVIQKGTERDLTVSQETRGWAVRDGEQKFKPEELANRNVDAKLRIDRFAPGDDTVIVKVNMTPEQRGAEFWKKVEGADKKKAVVLVDTKGRKYEAVGFHLPRSEDRAFAVHTRHAAEGNGGRAIGKQDDAGSRVDAGVCRQPGR